MEINGVSYARNVAKEKIEGQIVDFYEYLFWEQSEGLIYFFEVVQVRVYQIGGEESE